jgi:hypothetical protein
MKTRLTLLACTAILCPAAMAAAQTRPSTLGAISPYGLQRGTTIKMIVEGNNLAETRQVLFDDARITANVIDYVDEGEDVVERAPEATGAPITDRARDSRVTLELTVPADVPVGRHSFRLRTPLGTTNLRSFWVGDVPEVTDAEPNDNAGQAQAVALPVTVNGVIRTETDADAFKFDVKAGQEIVAAVVAGALGSPMDASLELVDANGKVVARNDNFQGRSDPVVIHKVTTPGAYVLRVTDAMYGGSKNHWYRLTVGELPYITSVFPLGGAKSAPGAFTVTGANLPSTTAKADLSMLKAEESRAPITLGRPTLNMPRVALGSYPEIREVEGNSTLATAQPISLPVTINGRIRSPQGPDRDLFKFSARKGERIVFTVDAHRLGSELDSVLEIVDAQGREIPRALVRPVWQTEVDLRNQGSVNAGMRLLSTAELRRGDWIYVDRELMRLLELPKGPDEDVTFFNFRGRRLTYEDTSPETHALGRPVYKVELHKPGTKLSPNGFPVFTITYRNDDGADVFGKDSRITFTAPAHGTYIARLTDSRGLSGSDFAYRLTVAPPAPDFSLLVNPTNPNVPRGGRIPVQIVAHRDEGFDGPIEVELTNLPAGLQATRGVVLSGHSMVSVILSASEDVKLDAPVELRVSGRATIDGRQVVHGTMPNEVGVVSIGTPPELRVESVEPKVIELEQGGSAKVHVRISRHNGFKGRVPLSVQNLPFKVTVPDVGLNGILITEAQDSREFTIIADEDAPLVEQTLFMTGRIEVNSSLPTSHASEPFILKVVPKKSPPPTFASAR